MKVIKQFSILFCLVLFTTITLSQNFLPPDTAKFWVFNKNTEKADVLKIISTSEINGIRIDSSLQIVWHDTVLIADYHRNNRRIKCIEYFYNSKKLRANSSGDSLGNYFRHTYYESGKTNSVCYRTKTKNGSSEYDTAYYDTGELQWELKRCYDSSSDISWYKNGQKKEEIINGSIDRRWCENGQKVWDMKQNAGKIKFVSFWCNGNKCEECTYIDMEFNHTGKYTLWYENGFKQCEKFYEETTDRSKCNIPTGAWIYWDEQGKIAQKEYYKHGNILKYNE